MIVIFSDNVTMFTFLQIVNVDVMTVINVIDSLRVALGSLIVQLLQKPDNTQSLSFL